MEGLLAANPPAPYWLIALDAAAHAGQRMAPVVSAVQTAVRAPVQTTTKKGMTREVSAACCCSPSAANALPGCCPVGARRQHRLRRASYKPCQHWLGPAAAQYLPTKTLPSSMPLPSSPVCCMHINLSAGLCLHAALAANCDLTPAPAPCVTPCT